jgi:hypothetical protein
MEASSRGEGTPDDALRRLEERLDRASEAAERLMAEAAAAAARRAQDPREAQGPGETQAAREAQGARAAQGPGEAQPPHEPGDGAEPPPAGWQVPASDGEGDTRSDLELLAQVLRAVRELIPPELERRLLEALRELLLATRALIDWYLERSETRRSAPARVQDIPIS